MQGAESSGKADTCAQGYLGRLGISWCADISDRQALEEFLKDSQIEAEGVYETLV